MSQVISVTVPDNFSEACSAFQKEADITCSDGSEFSDCHEFMVFYDKSAREIRCEGNYPDSVFSALVNVKEQFNGKLFYEGEEWNQNEDVGKASTLEKFWLILAIVFFPVTLIYLLLRAVVWVPYKIWKLTR